MSKIRIVLGIALALVFPFSICGAALGKQYLTVSALQLSPKHSEYLDDNTQVTANRFYTNSTSSKCWATGLNFPQGARITKLYVYFTSDNKDDLSIGFSRQDMRTNTLKYLYIGDVTQNSNKYVFGILPITKFNNVDNGTFIFGLDVCISTGTDFHGAIVEFTVP